MKKIIDKKMLVWLAGLIVLAIELVVVTINITSLNVLTYLLYIGFLPAIILFASSIVYSSKANTSKIWKYVLSIIIAIIFSAILIAYCKMNINEGIVEQIIRNSVTSDTKQVSMNTATVADNIQSILLYIAFSGIGCFIGTSVYKKKGKSILTRNKNNISEYDK